MAKIQIQQLSLGLPITYCNQVKVYSITNIARTLLWHNEFTELQAIFPLVQVSYLLTSIHTVLQKIYTNILSGRGILRHTVVSVMGTVPPIHLLGRTNTFKTRDIPNNVCIVVVHNSIWNCIIHNNIGQMNQINLK